MRPRLTQCSLFSDCSDWVLDGVDDANDAITARNDGDWALPVVEGPLVDEVVDFSADLVGAVQGVDERDVAVLGLGPVAVCRG